MYLMDRKIWYMDRFQTNVQNWTGTGWKRERTTKEKRGLRELRVLEKLKSMVSETNNQTLPSCQEAMHNSLNQALQTLETANHKFCRLQQREQEETELSGNQLKTDEIKNKAQRELLMKELECCQAEVDNKQRKAMEHLKEQYTEMEKDLSKCVSF
uniref:Biogenesis of lysosome-related organelles complex 1 subunit 5 n=1 Tax=Geotrypetes seraphini TaxID=260995 RepID=A0A6P8PQM7_GEOSA|nr:biogenesis of lysosome-related organelles complex 1 subunit 5 isoform X2 [Geotrypetes seraphini]